MKILVVEDERITAEDIRFRLEDMGHTVTAIASSGEESIQKVAETKPDFVLMDIVLKGEMDGIEAAGQIRNRFNVPAIYVTAHGEKSIFQRAKKTRPLGYILKPLQDMQFSIAIEIAIELYKAKKELQESNRRLDADLKQTQQQLIQQERLHALGTMASGIAHDFNNALTPILSFSEMLIHHPEILEDKEKISTSIQRMNVAAQDAAHVVRRLREFYRRRDPSEIFQPVNLNQLVEATISLTSPKWKDQAQATGITISINTDFVHDIPLVAGNEHELREVLTNLIFNAVDAMPYGGTITIRTCIDGDHVTLEVSDTGTGMTKEARERCFEPFFTTKQDKQRGTGLGLAMVHGIIQRHEGRIDIITKPGKGTTFIIRLPIQSDIQTQSIGQHTEALSRSLHVLVVDDEQGTLDTVTDYLAADGHTVVTAINGREGLEKFYADRFDVVVVDLAMPEMNGEELSVAIKKIAPNKPIVMLTGFAEMMEVTDEKPSGVDDMISKPVTIPDLRKAIAKVIHHCEH